MDQGVAAPLRAIVMFCDYPFLSCAASLARRAALVPIADVQSFIVTGGHGSSPVLRLGQRPATSEKWEFIAMRLLADQMLPAVHEINVIHRSVRLCRN